MPKMDETRLNIRYKAGESGVDELQAEITSALEELADPNSDLARGTSGTGFTVNEFSGAKCFVEQEGKGFGDVIVVIAIFAPAANHALRNVWDEAIWPRLKSRLGADAVGDEVDEGDGSQNDDGHEDSNQDDSER